MSAHPASGLQAASGLDALEIQPDLEPPPRAGTDGAKLPRAAQAHIGLLWCQLDIVAEGASQFDDLVVERTQRRLRTGVHRGDQLVATADG